MLFERIDEFAALLDAALRVHVQADVEGVAELIRREFWVGVEFLHEARVRAAHDLEIRPSQSGLCERWLDVSSPAVILADRRRGLGILELVHALGGKHPGIVNLWAEIAETGQLVTPPGTMRT